MPAIGVVTMAFLAILPSISPRRKNLEASAAAYGTVMIGLAAIFLVTQGTIVARAMDPAFDVLRWLFVAIGVLFAVVGNLLGKVRAQLHPGHPARPGRSPTSGCGTRPTGSPAG